MKNTIICILIALCLYFIGGLKLKDRRISALEAQTATLEADLKKHIIIKGRKIIYKKREGENVILQQKYLPVEGSADVKQDLQGSLTLSVKNKGFTFSPFAAALVDTSGAINAAAGARLVFYNTYGLGAAYAQNKGLGLVLDRRLDDILPLTQNTSALIFIGRRYCAAGIAVYF